MGTSTIANKAEGKDPRFAYTLSNGLRVLESFAGRSAALGNKDFCEATGLNKSVVSRLTRTLCSMGYLRPEPGTGKFMLGLAIASLAYPLLVSLPLRRIAHPLMQNMAQAVGGAVNLTMRDRLDLVIVDSCRMIETIIARPEIGARRPLSRGFLGPIYLAGLSASGREALLAELKAAGAADLPALRRAIETRARELEKSGYCFFSNRGLNVIASPLNASRQGEVALVHCVVEAKAMPADKMREEAPGRLIPLIRMIEEQVGTREEQV